MYLWCPCHFSFLSFYQINILIFSATTKNIDTIFLLITLSAHKGLAFCFVFIVDTNEKVIFHMSDGVKKYYEFFVFNGITLF